jgi:hypothetical protein
VRVHTDARAAESAGAVRAKAYTVGQHIVFAAGRYQPDAAGRRLLAHELAHTVQQQGVQRAAEEGATVEPHVEARLEREADAAASWIERAGPRPPVLGGAPSLTLLREEEGTPAPAPAPEAGPRREWEDLPADHPLRRLGIVSRQPGGPGGIAAFRVQQFPLPVEKGPVALPVWQARAGAQALETTIAFSGETPRTGLYQARNRTDELRSSWLGKLGWTAANAGANWQAAGGQASPAGRDWAPRALDRTCHMDHIVELQIGGTNSRDNIQVLDPSPNRASGRIISDYLRGLAIEARRSLPEPRPSYVLLHFDSVAQPAPEVPAGSCRQVEQAALALRAAPTPGTDPSGRALERYPIRAGAATDSLQVLPAPNSTDLSGDENRAPRQIIPGVLLNTLNRPANGNDTISASIDPRRVDAIVDPLPRGRTRVPLSLIGTPPPPLVFSAAPAGEVRELRLQRPTNPGINFLFPYLSPVHIDMRYDPATGWSGTGHITPSLPLLSNVRLQVEFGGGRLRAAAAVPPERLRSPIPGLRFTQAELGAQLLPEFEPSGVLAFEIGPRGRAIVNGRIEVTADPSGLVLRGPFTVTLPNVDPVEGQILYRGGELSGFVEITSERIRFPGVQRGSLRAEFSNRGVALSGEVHLLVAATPVVLTARRSGERWIFTGSARVTVPGGALDPLDLTVSTDGQRVWGEGRTAIRVRGLSGEVRVAYQDERWSGSAELPFRFGRASGSIRAELRPSGAIAGRGRITYPITDRLTATIDAILREDRTVRIDGELVFATIQLFERFPRTGGRPELFRFAPPGIPIWGIPLGPLGTVGLTAQIRVSVGVNYGVGPGELRNLRARAAFDLFAESPNFEFHGQGQIYVPFNAGFFVGLDGAIALDAAVASLSSGLSVIGEAGLRGQIQLNANVDYAAEVFALRARLEAAANPELVLGIDAFIRATVLGADVYEKRWDLARFRWGSDLRFGIAFPFEYASNRPFEMPSFESIEWIYPRDIDAAGMLRRLIA